MSVQPLYLCRIPVSPMRKEAAHRSEMISQLVFGETCTLLATAADNWSKVRNTFDGYEGWIQSQHIIELADSDLQLPWRLAPHLLNEISLNDEPMYLPWGTWLPDFEHGSGTVAGLQIEVESDQWLTPTIDDLGDFSAHFMHQVLNVSYLWGGRTTFGIDCSGLSQLYYKLLGIALPRDAYQQAELGDTVAFLEQAQLGDLAFFDNAEGKITHVGIMMNNQTILHSSAMVRLDPIDHVGILHATTNERTHQLRIIKRLL